MTECIMKKGGQRNIKKRELLYQKEKAEVEMNTSKKGEKDTRNNHHPVKNHTAKEIIRDTEIQAVLVKVIIINKIQESSLLQNLKTA